MTYFENQYGAISAIDTGNAKVLKICIQGFVPEKSLRTLLQHLTDCFRKMPWDAFLIDGQLIKVVAPATQRWLVDEWFTAVRSRFACNSKLAIINSRDFFGKIVISRVLEQMEQNEDPLPSGVFENEDDALGWIDNQPNAIAV